MMTRKSTTNKNEGFSLIELLIVVAIVLIIAAIAVPNLIRARIAANQSSAAASLRTLDSAATMYSNTYQNGYPPNPGLGFLAPPAGGGSPNCNAAGVIDATLAAGQKSGYQFTWVQGASPVPAGDVAGGCPDGYDDMFSVTASPFGFPTGSTYYCVDATGVIRQSFALIAATAAGCPTTALPIGND